MDDKNLRLKFEKYFFDLDKRRKSGFWSFEKGTVKYKYGDYCDILTLGMWIAFKVGVTIQLKDEITLKQKIIDEINK
jgi:hypothetical protein